MIASGTIGSIKWEVGEGVLKLSGSGGLPSYNPDNMLYPWLEYVETVEVFIIGKDITYVNGYTDYGCVNLKQIVVDPDHASYSVQDGLLIEGTTLLSCPFGWEGVCQIPQGVTTISDVAFYGCAKVTEIQIPDSVTSVGSRAFNGCKSLTAIRVSSGNTTFGEIDGVLFSQQNIRLYRYPVGRQGAYVIPEGVAYIAEYAFADCAGLTSLHIPNSMTVDGIHENAFPGCTSFVECTVDPEHRSHTAINGVLFSKDGTALDLCPKGIAGQFIVPESVTSIYHKAFSSCDKLTEIILPENVTYIGHYAFWNCKALETINLPDSLTGMGAWAFQGCRSLKSIRIPGGVTELYASAFEGCVELETVELSEGLERINSWVFYNCAKLEAITLPSTVNYMGWGVFRFCASLKEIEIPEGITTIGQQMFDNCTSLEKVVLPSTVNTIENSAFYATYSLSSINIPQGVTRIESGTFMHSGIQYIELPEGVTYLGTRAFHGSGLKEISLPSTIEFMGYQAFCYCTDLLSVRIPENVTCMEESVFWHTNSIKEVTLAAKDLRNIDWTVSGWSPSKKLIIANTVEVLDSSFLTTFGYQNKRLIFEGPSSFTYSGDPLYVFNGKDYIYLNDGVTYSVSEEGVVTIGSSGDDELGWSVVDGVLTIEGEGPMEEFPDGKAPWSGLANQITKIVIAEGITHIPDYAFDGMTDLYSIDIPSTVISVGQCVFRNCINLSEVLIPEGIEIGDNSFAGCSKLAEIDAYTTDGDGTRVYAIRDTMEEVLAAFPGTVAEDYRGTIFWTNATALLVTTNDIVITDTAQFEVRLSTPHSTDTLLTGQSAISELSIHSGNDTQGDYIRVYFRFSNQGGGIGYSVGEYTFDGHPIRVVAADSPNTWYLEVVPMEAGNTLRLSIPSAYENFTSGGGTVSIWLEKLTAEERQVVGNGTIEPDVIHMVTWRTQPDQFPLEQTTYGYPSVYGDGTQDGLVTLRSLIYSLKMTSAQLAGDYGRDIMTRASFQAKLTLPEAFYWHEDLLEAVRNNQIVLNYRMLYAIVDDTEVELCSWWDIPDLAYATVVTEADGRENILIGWMVNNPTRTAEMPSYNGRISFSNQYIVADMDIVARDIANNGGKPVEYTITNTWTCDQYFLYSEPQHQEATCVRTVSPGLAECNISKAVSSRTIWMGDAETFTITLSNTKSLPYTILNRVEDTLPEYFYITGQNMETMFRQGVCGEDLTIQISNAVLYGASYRYQVTGVNGQSFRVTQQQLGINTPHSGMVEDPSGDDANMACKNAQIRISWSADGQMLVLQTNANGSVSEYTIGSGGNFATVQDALDGVGYLVTRDAVYTCIWDRTKVDLYSGQTLKLEIPAHAKDTTMMLRGDTANFITEETVFVSGVYNYAKAYYQLDEVTEKYKSANCSSITINRDYALWKNVGFQSQQDKNIKDGSVLTYRITFSALANSATGNCIPMVDKMAGAQCLLVSVAENPNLDGMGLKTYAWNDDTYYLMTQPGTYARVQFGEYLADRVEIVQTEEGLETMIYWYFDHSIKGNTIVDYPALVDMEEAGLDADIFDFTLSNEVWINDHQTHRLYDKAFFGGSRLRVYKDIVTNTPVVVPGEDGIYIAADPKMDVLANESIVEEGQRVLYRLHLDGTGSADSVDVTGSQMKDVLPRSLNGYWSKENVQLFYAKETGDVIRISQLDGNEWYIESDSSDPCQQYIRWKDDFTLGLEGDLYIYVTLTFPSNENGSAQWSDYCYAFGSESLVNSFVVGKAQDDVFHMLKAEGSVYLQKGVLHTGLAKGTKYTVFEGEDDLNHYANDGTEVGIVTYYVTLMNDGITRMYLSDIQDLLPKGFTFHSFYIDSETVGEEGLTGTSNNLGYYDSMISASSTMHGSFVFKPVKITCTKYVQYGQTRLTFKLSDGSGTGALSYDEDSKKYYLNPGEAVVFAYNCRTNDFADTQDVANNIAAMPFYDYNGAGLHIAAVTADRAETNEQYSKNGTCHELENVQINHMGFDTGKTNNSTRWMVSEVEVHRGTIVPGITKTTPSTFAVATGSISWTLEATNSGTDTIRSYTLTDIMDAPYQICGDVRFSIRRMGDAAEDIVLFSFDSRQPRDTQVSITANDGQKDIQYVLNVNGEPVEITAVWEKTVFTPRISLERFEDGREALNIEFGEDDVTVTGISPGSVVRLVLTTHNISNAYSNTTYINTAYLTPGEGQYYEISSVTQGTNTLLDGKAAVMSEANVTVSYGYATASEKIVTEQGTEDKDNQATSNSAVNYIILADSDSLFRYTLKVTNTGNENDGVQESSAMGELVLIDNLPQVGDSITLYSNRARYSNFTVDFAENPDVVVMVNGEVLDQRYYTVSYSPKHQDFTDADWDGTSAWSPDSQGMRSIRVIISDPETARTGVDIIPAGAEVTVSFNAVIDEQNQTESIDPADIAWNSFGYQFRLKGDTLWLKASPMKIGVKIPCVPSLSKYLMDSNGRTVTAQVDTTFRFLIYKGRSLDLSSFSGTEVAQRLLRENIPFTVVDLTVKAGESTAELSMDNLNSWTLTDNGLAPEETLWQWEHLERYTIVELDPDTDSNWRFGSINGIRPNNSTFTNNADSIVSLDCYNVQNVWTLQVCKRSDVLDQPLGQAVFGLYSPNPTQAMTAEAYEKLSAEYGIQAQMTVEFGGQTWYLMDIQETESEEGLIQWEELTEASYYLLELKAPEGYLMNEQPGEIITATAFRTGSKLVYVYNTACYELPDTGGQSMLLYGLGCLLMAAAFLLYMYKKGLRVPGGSV